MYRGTHSTQILKGDVRFIKISFKLEYILKESQKPQI